MGKKSEKRAGWGSEGSTKSLLARSDNPMDWLFDNPMGTYDNFGFGVLRQSYRGFPNSSLEFGGRKLRPDSNQAAMSDREITASYADTVLPPNVPDKLKSPTELFKAMDDAVLPRETAVLIYATLAFPDEIREHHAWNEARAFAFSTIAMGRKLPAVICLHNPSVVGSDNPIHAHLLISPRRMDGLGFRGFDDELIFNEGQDVLFELWTKFRERWKEVMR